MTDPAQDLKNLKPSTEFLVGIDSDGCVFDTMEIKHKECFCPQFVNHFGLQPVSKYARETWEFVNLYSKTRGINRFKALVRALDLLCERREVTARHVSVPKMQGVRGWIDREPKLGNPALTTELKNNPDPDLKRALAWSLEVNEVIGKTVRNVPPFPGVNESLEKMQGRADAIVVSQTPGEALVREWKEHHLDSMVRAIAGQEMGTKAQQVALAAMGKYSPGKTLMTGDAPGDLEAARANGALFFPINPGREERSWARFLAEALDKFLAGTYAGAYEESLIGEFDTYLPEKAPWQE